MKFLSLVFALGAAIAMSAGSLSGVKSVYLMPMANGLDQYLAVRLTANGAVQVVTDPQKADAVVTDAVGSSFEEKFEDLFNKDKDKDAANGAQANDTPEFSRRRVSGGSRARGTVFLVDRKSREVIWSVFELPKRTSPDEMNATANRIADKLGKALTAKSTKH